ncbi:MAG: Ig-like domain-containing protein, partial [Oscillospiraceae bacterium]
GSLVLDDTVDGVAAAAQANAAVGNVLLNPKAEDAVTSVLAPGESCTFELVLSEDGIGRAGIRRPISKMFDTKGIAEFDLAVSYEETEDGKDRAAIRRKGTSARTSVQKTAESTLGLQAITVGAAAAPSARSRAVQNAATPAISIYTGETKSMNLKLEPYGSDKQYQIAYQSDHPEIVSVDPSTGEMTGHQAGNAQITLTATKPGTDILFAGGDGTISGYSGTKITHNEDGSLNNLPAETAEKVAVMEQVVAVTVTNAPTPPDSGSSGSSGTAVKNPDGSATTTVTDKKTGAVTETTRFPDGTKLETVTAKDGGITAKVTVPEGKKGASVTIPVKN